MCSFYRAAAVHQLLNDMYNGLLSQFISILSSWQAQYQDWRWGLDQNFLQPPAAKPNKNN